MRYKSLFESDNLHQMPYEHLHVETHNILVRSGFGKTGGKEWSADREEGPVRQPFRIYRDLAGLGWVRGEHRGPDNMARFFHPSGTILDHTTWGFKSSFHLHGEGVVSGG